MRLDHIRSVALILVCGCAGTSTQMTSVKDPEYGQHKYTSVIVVVNEEDLAIVKNVELRYLQAFTESRIRAIAGTSVIPPTRIYTPDELASVFKKNDVDAVLVVGFRGSGSSNAYIKLGSTPAQSSTNASVSRIGDNLYYSGVTTTKPGQEFGLTIPSSWTKFIIKLYDAASGQVAWMATSTAQGTWTNEQELTIAQAEKTVQKLAADGLVVHSRSVGFIGVWVGDYGVIDRIDHGSPASLAGMRSGDKIIRVNGNAVSEDKGVIVAELMRASGIDLKIDVNRRGEELSSIIKKTEEKQ